MPRVSSIIFSAAIAVAFIFEPVVPLPLVSGWQNSSKAFARVGRPLTPGSVAGVSRRTTRRTVRRVNYRNSVAGCSPYRTYYNCGGVYYAPTVQNNTTVYVVVNP